MRRVPVGEVPDHLTANLVQKVLELWGDMQAVGRKPDYLTYIELLRAFGKGGQLPQASGLTAIVDRPASGCLCAFFSSMAF